MWENMGSIMAKVSNILGQPNKFNRNLSMSENGSCDKLILGSYSKSTLA